jgi:DNA-binding response OmpR family regulator
VVDVASCGRDGFSLFGRGSYEFVLLDLMLPDVSGFDILREIAAKGLIRGDYSQRQSVDRRPRQGLALGADDYMTKPFSFSELRVRIRAIMRRRDAADTAFHTSNCASATYGSTA